VNLPFDPGVSANQVGETLRSALAAFDIKHSRRQQDYTMTTPVERGVITYCVLEISWGQKSVPSPQSLHT
jgi:hypothetical protein